MDDFLIPSNPDAPLAPHYYVPVTQVAPPRPGNYLLPDSGANKPTTISTGFAAPTAQTTFTPVIPPSNHGLPYTLPFNLN